MLNGGDDGAVRPAAVKLLARPGVDRDRGGSARRGGACDFHSIDGSLVPACTDFDRHRLAGTFYRSFHEIKNKLRVLHQGRAFPVFYDLRHRAAHVDVKDYIASAGQRFCRKFHDFRFMPKKLVCHRLLAI